MQLNPVKDSNKISIIYTTIDSVNEAESLANEAVNKKLAACVNIFPETISIYSWKSGIEKAQECSLLFKTIPGKELRLKEWLILNHPYETPAVLLWEADSTVDFSTYIQNETKE